MGRRINLRVPLIISVFLLAMACGIAAGEVIYIDDNASLVGDGTSWVTAYKYLQDALADSNSAEKPVEIRVAGGIYTPDSNSTNPNGSGDREATFQLINGVTIKGGYAGFGEPDPNERNVGLYETILSGDLYGNDVELVDPFFLLDDPRRAENSYSVVTCFDLDVTTVLDGFTIIAGNANAYPPHIGDPNSSGGGMYNDSSNLTVRNCTFRSNSVSQPGGGMYNYNASPTVRKCTFRGNWAGIVCDTVGSGGGMSNMSSSSPSVTNCTFSGNSVFGCGGAMCNSNSSSPTVTNCVFSRNWVRDDYCSGTLFPSIGGGGMYNSRSSPTVTNCTFIWNMARVGGAMYNFQLSRPTLTNCTFAVNSADSGGALVCNSVFQLYPNNIKLTNCILWEDGNEIWNYDNSVITIIYSDVQGGWPGEGNINVDPCFANTGHWEDPCNTPGYPWDDVWIEGDYHLKSQASRWDPVSRTWVEDSEMSPAIDVGKPSSDWTAELWPHGKRINMGAYGGTPQASMSLSDEGNIADLNIDGRVCYRDILLFTDKWLYEAVLLAEDLSRDGIVTFIDFAIFAPNWQPTPPGPATLPNPANGATNVYINSDLNWTACARATSHDVYFGTSSSPPFIRNQTATTFDPGTMIPGTTHYWRIDTVNAYGTTTGTVWSFTTMALEATNPNPADGATEVSTTADLSWTAGVNATSHDVYFGKSNPPPFIRNQTAITFKPGTMTIGTTYYWRIDEVGPWGTITGTVWRFTTSGPPP